MSGDAIRPANPAEAMAFATLRWTWPLYGLGALYLAGPVLAWLLAMLAGLSLYLGPAIRPDLRARGGIPPIVWAWTLGMLVMLVALWAGCLDWSLGTATTIKSTVGWAKGWALLPLFMIAGAVLPIRRDILIRGQCIVGLGTLLVTPILVAAPYAGLAEKIFTSPLQAVGGPGPQYFSVYFFTWDPESWTPRWQFYAPWSPFAALLGVMQVAFALEERSLKWRSIGVAAGTVMILLSKSRMGLVGLVACTVVPRMMPLLLRGWTWQALAGAAASFAVIGTALINAANDAVAAFRGARADSTRVRDALQRIAGERWKNEAFWFGHGTVQPGPHMVEFMPIGSHHTWWGLLFVKGAVGFGALLVPMLWHVALTLTDAARSPGGRLPLAIVMTIVLLSFGENLEIEAYMIWPGLMLLGIHAAELHRPAAARPIPQPSETLVQSTT